MRRLGIDTGGTFTDAVAVEDDGSLRLHKLPTVPARPATAVLEACARLAPPGQALDLSHGTTHATNALLTGELGRVAFLVTEGFADMLQIGRQDRDEVYALEPTVTRPRQDPALVLEVRERLAADGSVVLDLTAQECARLAQELDGADFDAVAILLLHAYRNPLHEQRLAEALQDCGRPLHLSHRVASEVREYERGVTTWADAALAPVVRRAMQDLQDGLQREFPGSRLRIMRSDGGTADVPAAVRHPAQLALSGPAGGLGAALSLARARGDEALITFDMGGTSSDVAWLTPERPELRPLEVGRLPLLVRGLPIHTVGTGGGSRARVDEGGALTVGPDSVGADPGPACYGRGGSHPSLTDAHFCCGRLPADLFLGGQQGLDARAALRVMTRLGDAFRLPAEEIAKEVLQVANAGMERALRHVSLSEGRDPREAVLYAFGGAGGLHAAWLAQSLDMKAVVIPPFAGAFSAVGLLGAPPRRALAQSVLQDLPDAVERSAYYAELETRALAGLEAEGHTREQLRISRHAELRARGQAGSLLCPEGPGVRQDFLRAYRDRFGFDPDADAVEMVAAHVTVDGPGRSHWPREETETHRPDALRRHRLWFGASASTEEASLHRREELRAGAIVDGPALIAEYSATTLVPPGWRARVDAFRCLLLEPVT